MRLALAALDGCAAILVVVLLAPGGSTSATHLLLGAALLVFLSSAMGLQEPLSSPKKGTLVVAIFLVAVAWSTCGVLLGIFSFPPPFVVPAGSFALLGAMGLARFGLAVIVQRRSSRVVVFGAGPRAHRIRVALERQPYGDKRFAGFMAERGQENLAGHPRYRKVSDLPKNCHLLLARGERGDPAAPDPQFGIDHQPCTVGDWNLRPAEGPADGVSGRLKRSMDLLIALAILLPVLAVIGLLLVFMLLTRYKSPIYRQVRLTLGGRRFSIYKLRTMPVGAEPKNIPIWPSTKDSRVTPIGKLLRNLWLDELPQLWNVLVGDLSWVGPRPERPEFAQVFSQSLPKYTLRHRARAGVTGLAQMRGFVGNTSLRKRLSCDLLYIRDWSPWLDVKVLMGTICQAFVRRQQPMFDFIPGDRGRIP